MCDATMVLLAIYRVRTKNILRNNILRRLTIKSMHTSSAVHSHLDSPTVAPERRQTLEPSIYTTYLPNIGTRVTELLPESIYLFS